MESRKLQVFRGGIFGHRGPGRWLWFISSDWIECDLLFQLNELVEYLAGCTVVELQAAFNYHITNVDCIILYQFSLLREQR